MFFHSYFEDNCYVLCTVNLCIAYPMCYWHWISQLYLYPILFPLFLWFNAHSWPSQNTLKLRKVIPSFHVDICWYMLISTYMLIYVDICWYMLIYVDICWYMLIYVDICWYVFVRQPSQLGLFSPRHTTGQEDLAVDLTRVEFSRRFRQNKSWDDCKIYPAW